MNVTELRIGNWVHIVESGRDYRVEQHNFCTDDEGYSAFLDHIKPIPLTEEWLLEFGFHKEVRIEGQPTLKYIRYIHDESWEELCLYDGESIFDYYFEDRKIPMPYVHQLQNLYFALTGIELEIKP